MPIRFDCPSCKANYEVADDLGGKMIMCRVCKKRGPVRSLTATTQPSMVKSGTASPSRRNFLLIGGGVLASLGAIATGAGLAQWRPWRHWGDDPNQDRRRRGGPPQPGDGQNRPPRDRRGPPPERKDQEETKS
ncbi:MAG TPA: hypothetical protein VMG10_37025 [Gemmataceae bacterium]|nr:hypothetical protein [Gemmataceae bacterium]